MDTAGAGSSRSSLPLLGFQDRARRRRSNSDLYPGSHRRRARRTRHGSPQLAGRGARSPPRFLPCPARRGGAHPAGCDGLGRRARGHVSDQGRTRCDRHLRSAPADGRVAGRRGQVGRARHPGDAGRRGSQGAAGAGDRSRAGVGASVGVAPPRPAARSDCPEAARSLRHHIRTCLSGSNARGPSKAPACWSPSRGSARAGMNRPTPEASGAGRGVRSIRRLRPP